MPARRAPPAIPARMRSPLTTTRTTFRWLSQERISSLQSKCNVTLRISLPLFVRFQSKKHPADSLQVPRMDGDMLSEGMHVPECALDRVGSIKRSRTTGEIDEIHCLHSAGDSMPTRQEHL